MAKKERKAKKTKGAPGSKVSTVSARSEKRRDEKLEKMDRAEVMKNRSGDEYKWEMKNRLRQKMMERAIARKPAKEELVKLYRDLARLHSEQQRNDQALALYDKLYEIDPEDSLDIGVHYLTLLMDNSECDRARDFLDKHSALKDNAIGAYTYAMIEYISSVILEEEGSDYDQAVTLLKKAVEINPFIAEFVAFNEIYTEAFDPGLIDEMIGWNPQDKDIDIALQYCATYGQISVWMDLEGADYWVRNSIYRDEDYTSEHNALVDVDNKGIPKLVNMWAEARKEAVARLEESSEEMSSEEGSEEDGSEEEGDSDEEMSAEEEE